jgi:hypothetical protein
MSLIRPATQPWLHSDTAHSLEPLLTLVRSQPLQPPGADHRAGQVQECGEEVSAPLVANREAADSPATTPATVPPSNGGDPAGSWTPPHVGRSRADPAAAQDRSAARVVVPCRRAAWLGADEAVRDAPWPDNCRDRVHELLQQLGVVGVGRREPNRQLHSGGVDQQVILGAWLAPVDRIGANEVPPRRARPLTESIAALDPSTWPSSPSQSSRR